MSANRLICFVCLILFATAACTATLQAGENLLRNPGFEQELLPTWEKRTPEDDCRKLRRVDSGGRSGNWAVALDNVKSAHTRLRQGNDRSIIVEPGSLVELSAWVKSELTNQGKATLQLYGMNERGGIRVQPKSRTVVGSCDWTRLRALARVPDDTAYLMAYLQIQDAVGRVLFDDVELVVKRKPSVPVPAPKIGLLTDLAADSPCAQSLKVLFADGLIRVAPESADRQLADCLGALVLFESCEVPQSVLKAVEQFAGAGKPVFMDIRNFAQWQGTKASAVCLKVEDGRLLENQMAAGLRLAKESKSAAGFTVGQTMPRAGYPSGELLLLPKGFAKPGLEVLAVGPDERPGLVRMPVGKGAVVAADVLSLREPFHSHVDAYYKYAPIANTLTNPVKLGEYYPKQLSYAEFVDRAKKLAASHPAIRFQDEGPASRDYRIFSLNLGTPGKPLYFMYAAAHGSEWEPGYGLMTFAKRIAEGRLDDVIDLKKVNIKIVPYINPWGYDNRRRQNARGVDLNRQGDHRWAEFKGRDSTEDGVWAAGDYDWKGSGPFTEPETQTYKAILDRAKNLYCVLDYHGNSTVTSNKIGILPVTGAPDNELRAIDLQYVANQRLRGRHLLRQNKEETVSQYLLERVFLGGNAPYLMNSSMRDRHGLLIELTAGYGQTYGTVLQTDVTCELCRSLLIAYPPPKE